MLSLTVVQRTIFILSIVVLFWIAFLLIYLASRLIIRLISNFHPVQSTSKPKVFVISSNQCGSFRPIPTLHRSDSLFSQIDFAFPKETIKAHAPIHLTINHDYQQSKGSLLEHYLTTYNPLQLDLTASRQETITTSNVKAVSSEDIPSETGDNCLPLHCTNKQIFRQTGRYVRLKEQDKCSATFSLADERLSECSTKSTGVTIPVVMVTDCSNAQRLHTEILEMDEEEE